jgi:L-alanine-DL-glutamate epimerase-like enolase superfamily enzyme
MENPPLVDRKGYMPLPQAPGLGVVIKKESMQA